MAVLARALHCSCTGSCQLPVQFIFPRETGSAALFRIQSSSAESGQSPPDLYFALSWGATNSFAGPVFLFSPAWGFQQQSDSALERSRYPARAFWLVAKQTGQVILLQLAPRPIAFLQA